MTFFELQQTTAVLILSATLGALPTLAQSTAAKSPATSPATTNETPQVTGKVVEDIIARVNDQIVTQSDYDRAAEQLDAEAKQQAVPAHELAQKQADLLRDLIDQQLLLSKGKELNITGETELVKRLDEIRKQNHLDSMEDLEKAATQQGVSYEDFKANIRNSIITQQVVRDEVGRRISMSPGEVQKYFTAHESEFAQQESVTLNEILIPTPAKSATEGADDAEVAAAKAKADALVAKLAAGAKFDDLAKPAPTDPNEPKSVSLGQFRRDQLAGEIAEKAFALQAGQYTQPIRTKQGFIILQVVQHNPGGEGSFKQVEPQVEEALFLERMQPALRVYLTKLREEAYVQLKAGVVDTGASGNEMRLSYSAYTPPAPKKKKKFARARFRGVDRSKTSVQTAAAKPTAAAAPVAASTATAAATTNETAAATGAAAGSAAPVATAKASTTQQASNADQNVMKPGKREKIRYGQAPRESLPSSANAPAEAPTPGPAPDATAQTASVTTPEVRFVNPDGTVTSSAPTTPDKKTRLSSRPPTPKNKKVKGADAAAGPTAEELATQKVQEAPMGLARPPEEKKKQKADKSRLTEKPKQPDQTPAPYLGAQPESTPGQPAAPDASPAAPSTGQPDAGAPAPPQ